MKSTSLFRFALLVWAVPAFASVSPNVIVSSPVAGATVGTTFVVQATTTACSSEPVAATGYSIDIGATTIVNAASINAQVTALVGAHTLHVKSWGNAGAGCDTDVPIEVSASAAPAQITNVAVSQPAASAELVSPFAVVASGTECDSQPVVAMGFSMDNSAATTIIFGASVDTHVSSATGAHTLHVKSWGKGGSSCVSNVPITVVASPVSTLPSNTIAVRGIQAMANWEAAIDTATAAGASTLGATELAGSPSLSGTSRKFATTFAGIGGERYDVSFGSDTSATNFLYDGWVYLSSPSSDIANLEFDLNQVVANGDTVIFGIQCDTWSKTWDYTANAGTVQVPVDVWRPSTASCNVQSWSTNTWHHVQISYARDAEGNATYQSVWLDNVKQDLNVTVPAAFALGWGSTLLTNFQVDSMTGSEATTTAYLDDLTVYRW
jgi:mRNA-degrading endonuclease toxin of MazEF toxin-antitoxin module